MNKPHRDIKPESIVDYKERIEEIGDSRKKVYVKPPSVKEGTWFEEFVLDRVLYFIRQSVELRIYTEIENGALFVFVIVKIAGRKLLDERIKLI